MVHMRPAAVLNYSIKNTWNDVRQISMWKSTTNVGCTHALPINLVELVMIVVVWMVVVTVVVEFGSIEVPLHPLVLPCTSIAWESQTDESTLHWTGWKVLDHQQQGHLPVVLWSIKKCTYVSGWYDSLIVYAHSWRSHPAVAILNRQLFEYPICVKGSLVIYILYLRSHGGQYCLV